MQRFARHTSCLPPGTEWEDNARRRCPFPMPEPRLAADDNDLKIVARHHHGAVTRAVELADQGDDVAFQCLLRGGLQRGERLQHRPVVGAEYVKEVLRRAVAEYEGTLLGADRMALEQFVEASPGAP